MTVSFQDGTAPASATFPLVVHPSEAARLVEVTRQPRTLASYREGEQQARAEARRCREEKTRLEARCSGQVGLLGLLAQGLLNREPLLPGQKGRVGVEVEATEAQARGTFTLKLWGQEGGGGSELFDGVTFP